MTTQVAPNPAQVAPQDLPQGSQSNDDTLEFWTPERAQAWQYALAGVDLERIAVALGRSRETVHAWVAAPTWRARAEKHRSDRAAEIEGKLALATTAALDALPRHVEAKGGGMIALEVLDRRRVLEKRPDKLANADGSNLPAGVVVVLRPAAPPDEPVLELGAGDVQELGEPDIGE